MFSMAREGQLKINGWPNFQQAIQDLQTNTPGMDAGDYEVCIAFADGALVVKQALLDLYMVKHPQFKEQTQEALENHNQEFNPKGLTAGVEEENSGNGRQSSSPAAPKLDIQEKSTLDKVTNEESRLGLGFLRLKCIRIRSLEPLLPPSKQPSYFWHG